MFGFQRIKEKIGKGIFAAAAIVCTISVVAIFGFLIIKSVPALIKIGFFDFLFGSNWAPNREDGFTGDVSGSYGIFKMIVGTLAATTGAVLIGGIIGYFTAIFLAFYCPKIVKRPFSAVINLLAGIPSVVYGFFGITFLLPLLAKIAPNNGSGLLATSIILGVMILPTVVSLSKTSLEAVPKTYYEGAVAMGSTKSQAIFKILSPSAKSGITASLILGTGRALGETMAVIMVAGNSVAYPEGFFSSFRVLTANIVLEMGYAGDLQQGALIATGVVLLVFVLLINTAFNFVSGKVVTSAVKRSTKKKEKATDKIRKINPVSDFFKKLNDKVKGLSFSPKYSEAKKYISVINGLIAGLMLFVVVGFVFYKGVPELIKNPSVIYGRYEYGSKNVTILPSIITTLYTVGLSLLISVPIGISAAIFLNEYANAKNPLIRIIRVSIDVLSGVPSIVYGLFGMITFVKFFTGSSSIIAGVCTISMMLLPTIVRSVEESLKSVPDGLREGSYALGTGKVRTIFKIVLPSALPGILSAIILATGRIVSESAPFVYTMGSVISATPKSVTDSGATLAVALYNLSREGWHLSEAYAAAVVLIVIVLLLNLLAEVLATKLQRKTK